MGGVSVKEMAVTVTSLVFILKHSLISYLQFFLIEGLEQVLRNNLIEAFLQGQKLSLDAMQETPVHIQPVENMTNDRRGRNTGSLSV